MSKPTIVQFLPATELPERTRNFLRWTREIGTAWRPDMVGFVVLAWGEKGDLTICGDTSAKENPIPNALLPAWVAEHLRAEYVTGGEVKSILRDIGVLAPKPPEGA